MTKLRSYFTDDVVARSCLLLLLMLFVGGIAIQPVHAQSTFGSIVGTVKDASGAVVNGASVTLINTGTSITHDATTNQNGDYSFTNLNPAKYEVSVVASGFEKVEFHDLDLQSREIKRVDAALKIGTASDTISVKAHPRE